MKIVGMGVLFAAALAAAPVVAQSADTKQAASSGGLIDRLWTAISGSDSAATAPDGQESPATEQSNAKGRFGTEPKPLITTGADMSDEDSYKPDAGDADH